ncbi:MAG: hypothetical protein LBJ26_07080 [Paenibacillus sp.]|jgi:hypothetical protein|nr:hypothetical protein [Paenibacillus sp.]
MRKLQINTNWWNPVILELEQSAKETLKLEGGIILLDSVALDPAEAQKL